VTFHTVRDYFCDCHILTNVYVSKHHHSHHSHLIDNGIISTTAIVFCPNHSTFQYACGGWISNTTIPEKESRYVRSFNGIADRNKVVLQSILENPAHEKIHRFYKSCMDTERVEREGVKKPLTILNFIQYHLRNSTASTLKKSTFEVAGYLRRFGIQSFLSFSSEVDKKNPDRYIARITQNGVLSLPRSVYTSETKVGLRQLYLLHITNMFALLNVSDASDMALRVLEVETTLATIFQPSHDLRNPFKSYNPLSISLVKREFPGIEWDAYTAAFGTSPQRINVAAPNFIGTLSEMMPGFTIAQLEAYLKWRALHTLQDFMPQVFRNENFDFFGKVIQGLSAPRTRTELCIESAGESIGFEVGKKFVDIAFPEQARQKAKEMIDDIQSALRGTLQNVNWMDIVTKGRALQKLSKVKDFVGSPNYWPSYESVEVCDSYFDNKINYQILSSSRSAARVDQAVNKDLWPIPPQTVNAFYDPPRNSINFPAAIMANPFFSEQFPAAMNYGGIGLVISHEYSHGYDDQGRMYDGDGRLEDWWTSETSDKFKERAQCLVDQYSAFEPLPGFTIDGAMTVGENLADGIGIKLAYLALKNRIDDEGGLSDSIVPGFNRYQLFYLSFAQSWCSVERREETIRRLEQDVHSPPRFRILGPLQNSPHFADTFQCPIGSYMNPKSKCEIF